MKNLILIGGQAVVVIVLSIVSLLSASCNNADKQTHESVTNLPLPEESKIIESYDDKKFVNTIALEVDKKVLENYIRQHGFRVFDQMQIPKFWSANHLKENKPDFSNLEGFYYTSGTSGESSWIYIADLKNNRLWAEIKHQQKGY